MAQLDEQLRQKIFDTAQQTQEPKIAGQVSNEELFGSIDRKKSFGGRVLGGALKVIDILERPYYGVSNTVLDLINKDGKVDLAGSFSKGFIGKEKTEFSDLTSELGWKPETTFGKVTKGAVDFVGGVLLDPTTYVTFGYGKGAMIIGRGMKPLNKAGKEVFEKIIKEELEAAGKKGVKKLTAKAVQKADPEIYAKAIKRTLAIADKAPEKYFAKRAVRFAGKGEDLTSAAFKPVSKVTKRISDLPVIRTAVKGKPAKLIGELFNPNYKILKSKNLTQAEKFDILLKSRAYKTSRELAANKNILTTVERFKDFTLREREQVTFELEKFLGKMSNYDVEIKAIKDKADELFKLKAVKNLDQSPRQLIESGNYAEAIAKAKTFEKQSGKGGAVANITQAVKQKVSEEISVTPSKLRELTDIKDEKIRNVVMELQDELRDLWNKEVIKGVRDPQSFIEEGYVKRILKGLPPEEVLTGSRRGRLVKAGKMDQTIEESVKAAKSGEQHFQFEADAAKWLAARKTESDFLTLKKENLDWLVNNSYVRRLTKKMNAEDLSRQGFEMFEFNKQKYAALPEVAKEFNLVMNKLDIGAIDDFFRLYDDVLNIWKTSVTSLFPSFHSRNAISNIYLTFLGGLKNPNRFRTANKIQWYGRQLRKGGKVKDKIVKLGGQDWKLSELYELSLTEDILGTGFSGRDFLQKVRIKPKAKEFIQRPGKAALEMADLAAAKTRKVGTTVENNARVALFVDQLAKGVPVDQAAIHTKKFLFDYSELTDFEQKVLKRIIPFYTWIRKNIPLQLEQMAAQPGKYTGALHAKDSIEQFSAAEEEEFLPPWLREEELTVRLPGKKYFKPDLPFQDLATMFQIKNYVSATSPLIKGWFEIIGNKNFFTGRPLANENLPESKFKREKIKNWVLDNLRVTSYWRKASKEDKDSFSLYLDLLFGLNVTPFDIAKSKKYELDSRKREISSERKFLLDKAKKQKEKKEALETFLPFLKE